MKILMLSWEYPPRNIGGLSNHVYNLSHALKDKGHEVYVITCEEGTAPKEELDDGVFVRRVEPYKINTEDFIKWVMHLNYAMIEEGMKLLNEIGRVDIIHAHDWLTYYAAKTLKWSFKIPMLCTIHSTEYGRNNGIRSEMQRYISDTEYMLINEARKVVVCSKFMRCQLVDVFKYPLDNICEIPNAVELKKLYKDTELRELRKNIAEKNEKIIFFIGRHVFEKGIQLLIDAIPRILKQNKNVKFVIAGVGPMSEDLKMQAENLGVSMKVNFIGYLEESEKDKLYRIADVAVIPSLYEPFGIVALEAMAAGCPLVASDTGGLSELIRHRENGLKANKGSSESIADNILEILNNNEIREKLKIEAYNMVKNYYTWDKVAAATEELYSEIKDSAKGTQWEVKTKKIKTNKGAEKDKLKTSSKPSKSATMTNAEVSADVTLTKRGRKKKI